MNGHLSLQRSGRIIKRIVIAGILFFFNGPVSQAQQAPQPPAGVMAGQATRPVKSPEAGLLFYLSGEKNATADFAAGGQTLPNFLSDVKTIPGGAFGSAFEAADNQLMSYWAPGNIYAQRGTLSFFWRSRYPVGPNPFPVFRVAYADHSSWDMVPALKAPLDLVPEWIELKITVPKGSDISNGSVQLDPEKKMDQITRLNDYIKW